MKHMHLSNCFCSHIISSRTSRESCIFAGPNPASQTKIQPHDIIHGYLFNLFYVQKLLILKTRKTNVTVLLLSLIRKALLQTAGLCHREAGQPSRCNTQLSFPPRRVQRLDSPWGHGNPKGTLLEIKVETLLEHLVC